jgi:DNA helicase IV
VLIDEAESILNGTARPFGHTIVDEAQDLSAMEFRMIYRRTRGRSITILGDLAQATSASAQTRWEDVMIQMGDPDDAEIMELSLGYRVPAPLLEFANRLLPVAAPGVTPARSVRAAGEGPRLVATSEERLIEDVVAEARTLAQVWQTVGLICSENMVDLIAAALSNEGIAFGTPSRRGLEEIITLLPAVAAKGLEFDGIVVVEPAEIMAEEAGPRRLYVSLTRAVQQLSIVHAGELPTELRVRAAV